LPHDNGLALTPPVIGRISIGKVVERNGKRLPEKDDEFTITSQVQNRDGWVNRLLDKQLRKDKSTKLRCIPVRLLFDDPDLSLRARYTMSARTTGRPLCVGNGSLVSEPRCRGCRLLRVQRRRLVHWSTAGTASPTDG
jgi:hypothetical protein